MQAEIARRLALQARGSMLPFTTRDARGRVVGMTTYMNIDAVNRRVEIGSTWTAALDAAQPVQHRVQAAAARPRVRAARLHRGRVPHPFLQPAEPPRDRTPGRPARRHPAQPPARPTAPARHLRLQHHPGRMARRESAPALATRQAALSIADPHDQQEDSPLSASTTSGNSSASARLAGPRRRPGRGLGHQLFDGGQQERDAASGCSPPSAATPRRLTHLRREGRPPALVADRRRDRLRRQARAAGPQGRDAAALPDRARRRRGAPGERVRARRRRLQVVSGRQAHRLRRLGLARAEGRQGAGQGAQGMERAQGDRPGQQRGALPLLGRPPADRPGAASARARRRERARHRPVRGHRPRADPRRPGRRRLRHLARRQAHRVRLRPGAGQADRQLQGDRRTARCAAAASRPSPPTRPGISTRRATAPTAATSRCVAANMGKKHTRQAHAGAAQARRRLAGAERRLGPRRRGAAALVGGRRARSTSRRRTAAAATSTATPSPARSASVAIAGRLGAGASTWPATWSRARPTRRCTRRASTCSATAARRCASSASTTRCSTGFAWARSTR